MPTEASTPSQGGPAMTPDRVAGFVPGRTTSAVSSDDSAFTVGRLLDLISGQAPGDLVLLHVEDGEDVRGYGFPLAMHGLETSLDDAHQSGGLDRDLLHLFLPLTPTEAPAATVGDLRDMLSMAESHRVVVLHVVEGDEDDCILIRRPEIVPGGTRIEEGREQRVLGIRFAYEEF